MGLALFEDSGCLYLVPEGSSPTLQNYIFMVSGEAGRGVIMTSSNGGPNVAPEKFETFFKNVDAVLEGEFAADFNITGNAKGTVVICPKIKSELQNKE